jgi:hypothetical protein
MSTSGRQPIEYRSLVSSEFHGFKYVLDLAESRCLSRAFSDEFWCGRKRCRRNRSHSFSQNPNATTESDCMLPNHSFQIIKIHHTDSAPPRAFFPTLNQLLRINTCQRFPRPSNRVQQQKSAKFHTGHPPSKPLMNHQWLVRSGTLRQITSGLPISKQPSTHPRLVSQKPTSGPPRRPNATSGLPVIHSQPKA